ncbi:MAG: hypothetical protein J7604_25920 [Sporocytophaga sp.]|uniref:hypothetical protein n=1 Tax=Sporocytophaga sp. TaxID=2231183 RepID=UPI001B154E8C|nr:hypothetical protein [Sporocytophaga sp.]MBO9703669.1 hypothetical protein [Sporocytophaga sp.]
MIIRYTQILDKKCKCGGNLYILKIKGQVYDKTTRCLQCGNITVKLDFDPNTEIKLLPYQRYTSSGVQNLLLLVYKNKAFLEGFPVGKKDLAERALEIVKEDRDKLMYARISYLDKNSKKWCVVDLLNNKKIDRVEMLGFDVEQVYQFLYSKNDAPRTQKPLF